jgi:beta-galactosidase
MTFFSGIADAANRVRPGGYPGPFRDLLGMTVEEIVPFPEDGRNAVELATGQTFEAAAWADVIRPEGADVVATFKDDFYAGRAAITRHRADGGEAWYVGTRLDGPGMAWLVGELCAAAGVGTGPGSGAVAEAPPGVELVTRRNGAAAWTFVLNHSDVAAAVRLREPAVEVLSGRRAEGSVNVLAGDIAILRTG